LATGATLAAAAVTVVVKISLLSLPSLTTKLATYTPTKSAVKVGLAVVVELNAAELPIGLANSTHL
jgi:hypothetical protein